MADAWRQWTYLAIKVCLPMWIKSSKGLTVLFAYIQFWIEGRALKYALHMYDLLITVSAVWNRWMMEVSKASSYTAWLMGDFF